MSTKNEEEKTKGFVITANDFKSMIDYYSAISDKPVYRQIIDDIDRELLKAAALVYGHNQTKIAKVFGIDRITIKHKLNRLKLDFDRKTGRKRKSN